LLISKIKLVLISNLFNKTISRLKWHTIDTISICGYNTIVRLSKILKSVFYKLTQVSKNNSKDLICIFPLHTNTELKPEKGHIQNMCVGMDLIK
jgi:hypothetical protein